MMIIAIDFDGTIVEDNYPMIGCLIPDSVDVINELYEAGNIIIIWTCREGNDKMKAEKFLFDNGIMYHYINENVPGQSIKYKNDCRKIGANVFIDDKNFLGFPGWKSVKKELLK